jgi:hypothetical protein
MPRPEGHDHRTGLGTRGTGPGSAWNLVRDSCAGGRYVTLVGSNPLFHLPQDRWPHAVDVAAVARIAAAAARLVVKLTR